LTTRKNNNNNNIIIITKQQHEEKVLAMLTGAYRSAINVEGARCDAMGSWDVRHAVILGA